METDADLSLIAVKFLSNLISVVPSAAFWHAFYLILCILCMFFSFLGISLSE